MATSSSTPVSNSMLTLKYGGAVFSALAATYGAVSLLSDLFGLWTGSGASLLGGYVGIVTTAVVTVLFAVLAFLLYKGVTKAVAAQPGYINTPVYHFITNGFFAVLAVVSVFLAGSLVAVLLSSLLLIGTSTDIGALYLGRFLPELLALAIVGFVGFAALKIMKGKNLSTVMTLVLMSLAGALLIATLITVPIVAHGSSSRSSSGYNYDLSDYLNMVPNGR